MEIVTKKEEEKRNGRLLDGIDTILDLSEEDFEELYKRFVQKEEIRFYYTTDKYENEAGKEQIGLAKYFDEQGNRIYKAYYYHTI